MEIIKNVLIAMGGGATALISLLTVFKSMFLKVFDNAIDTTFDKNFEKYRNKLTRATAAYDFLLKKEMKFYELFDTYVAKLVPLIQDLVYYAKEKDIDQSTLALKYKEELMTYLEMIQDIKNDILLYQSYIPKEIFAQIAALLAEIQKELPFWKETGESLFCLNGNIIDAVQAEQISDSVLMNLAKIESTIKKRLVELSNP